jgi:MFS family permease
LALTVLATITLYYELYVGGSVSTLILPKLGMSFSFYVYATGISNLLGAFGSLFAGLADRVGRTNLVAWGLLLTAIGVEWLIPMSTNKYEFFVFAYLVGIIEGICLVATPALIRDFSPQVGRATAMGWWTAGPVLGSLVVAEVATATIPNSTAHFGWGHEFVICGIVGLVVAGIALLFMKELSPGLRDQLMVTMQDRALIEAKAKGIDIEASLRNPWRQLMKPDVVISAAGVSIFLLIYYTVVGFGLLYYATVFGFTTKQSNSLLNWSWWFNAAAVIIFGFLSDKVRVRKPFMILGGVLGAVMMVIYLEQAGHHPSYHTLAVMAALLSVGLGLAYVPWMASYTETVEHHNPALTATGLAIWGWIIRVVVCAMAFILPSVINTMNPLVTYGTQVATYAAEYPAFALGGANLASIKANPSPSNPAFQACEKMLGAKCVPDLIALTKAPASTIAFMTAHGAAVANADAKNPGKWKDWYWVCFGCMVFFLCTVPLMRGRWSPRKAREDEEAHEAMVQAEMAKLGITASA